MCDFKIVAKPFTWKDNLSEVALEDFSLIQKRLPYGICSSIGMALAKLKIMEDQGMEPDEERLEREEKIDKWIEQHDGEDYCHYCIHNDDCPHGVVCYGGSPVEPPCCTWEIKELLDIDLLLEDLENEDGKE